MILLEKIKITNNGKRVDFVYTTSQATAKFFNQRNRFFVEYDIDVSNVPESILCIPFLANVVPISWFAGFDVQVNEIDQVFFQSLENLKAEFSKYYPIITSQTSNLLVNEKVINQNEPNIGKNAMLFSGGVDAYTTLMRYYEENLDLITIHGADINLSDEKQWKDLVNYNSSATIIKNNKKFYIKSNIREFITHDVNKLLDNLAWWGFIQHGMSITSLTAPLGHVMNYKTIYIASSNSADMPFSAWGSMPETDNLMLWANKNIFHDGYELSRLNKIQTILDKSNSINIKPPLRVCYNEYKTTLNCNQCEKCCRTIFGIMLNNENPEDYGFIVEEKFYDLILRHFSKGFNSQGTKFYWDEMILKYNKNKFYFISDPNEENEKVNEIIKTYHSISVLPIGNLTEKQKMKLNLIAKFPNIFNIYLKIRRKFL